MSSSSDRDYVLGTHDEEIARLGLQHRVWRPMVLECWYRAGNPTKAAAGSNGTYLGMAFWGLWLFPFGVLVFKSGFLPRLLGVLLIVGCFAYLAVSVTSIVLPAYRHAVDRVMLPFYAIGELSMMVWLLVKGAKVQPHTPATRTT